MSPSLLLGGGVSKGLCAYGEFVSVFTDIAEVGMRDERELLLRDDGEWSKDLDFDDAFYFAPVLTYKCFILE